MSAAPEQRATFWALADVLIPATDAMPAASEAGSAEKWLDRALAARPDLVEPLAAVLDAAAGKDPDAEARRLHADDPDGFSALAQIASGGYYMNLKVRKRVGYPGQGKRPPFSDEAEYDLRDGLLDPVYARGPINTTEPPPPDPVEPPAALPFSISANGDGSKADVLVIGAGAGGSVAARHLAEAGFKVVCLEQGGWENASDFPGDKLEWELVADAQWSPNPNTRQHPSDYPLEVSGSPITPVMYNAVGGSTIHFCAQWVRLRPQDYKLRTLHGIADDWPISYEEMKPYYEQIDQEMQISGMAGDPNYPPGPPPLLPPLPIGPIGRRAAEGMNELSWHWWPAAHAIRSAGGRQPRRLRAHRHLHVGLPQGREELDRHDHVAAGARPRSEARHRRPRARDHDERGRASPPARSTSIGTGRSSARRPTSSSSPATASAPRASSSSRAGPDGLANSSGLVGKRLMLHPYMSVLGIYEDDLEGWLGPWGTQLLSLEFADHDESRGFPLGAQWDVMPLGGPLFTLFRYDELPFDERWGAAVHDLTGSTLGHAFDWGVGIEDLPHESNTVTIDPELTDTDGIPAPKITFTIDDEMRANLEFQLARAKEAHEAAGATKTIVADWSQWGWHLLGTTRMGDDPATSVVDRWCAAHDVPNLYVLDGAVFPTSGPMAPTSTICANSLRCTERLIERARLQPTPA